MCFRKTSTIWQSTCNSDETGISPKLLNLNVVPILELGMAALSWSRNSFQNHPQGYILSIWPLSTESVVPFPPRVFSWEKY